MYSRLCIALCVVLVSACGGARDATATLPWVLHPNAIGGLRTGMSVAAASQLLNEQFPVRPDGNECAVVYAHTLPAGVRLMVERDTLVRIDVDSNLVATDSGARVGDSEAAVIARYHGQLRVEPHKYTGPEGHYLIFSPIGDTLHRIIFETDGKRVTTMRSGRRPAVEYVEGCA